MIGRGRRGSRLGVGESRAAVIGLGIGRLARRPALDLPRRLDRVHELQDRAGRVRSDAASRPLVRSLQRRQPLDRGNARRCGTAFTNSLVIVLVSTAIVMLLALPAAYALAIRPVPKWRDVLFFFISTKFLPIVASIFPIYVYAEKWNLIGTRTILIVLYIAINLPLAIWMTRSFFIEVPRELIEAAEIDGTSLVNQLRSVILPIAAPGIAATALLCVIFAWNEYFYAIQLNFAGASTMPQWVIGNVSTRGNFLAKLSAASMIACLPVVLAGWAAQKRMIRGLSMGALK